MVVITVIAILSTIALFGIGKAQSAARDVSRQQIMNGIRTALARYYGDFGHYPIGGDAVPGGSSLCCNNFFNGMMTGLAQNNYLSLTSYSDPLYKLVYSTFGGGERYNYQSGWTYAWGDPGCGFGTYYDNYNGNKPFYGWITDGQTYTLCLIKESGGVSLFKSPQ